MRTNFCARRSGPRRGAVLALSLILLIIVLAFVAFAVDIGYICVARAQLQNAADSAALAAAGAMGQNQDLATQTAVDFAANNVVGAQHVQIKTSDVKYGTWDPTTRTFTPAVHGLGNAVQVTARSDESTTGRIPSFFGRVLTTNSLAVSAKAVATTNPRDICFVVDLSGSMNDDTDPSNTAGVDGSYPGVGTQMVQQVYNDFGFGTYPGTSEAIGKPLGVTTISALTNTKSSPLLNTKQPRTLKVGSTNYSYTVPTAYQIKSSDSSSVRTKKAYSWVMDVQLRGVAGFAPLPGVMPAAKPVPNSADTNSYNYWQYFLSNNSSNIGYKAYMSLMMDSGRDKKPASNSNLYTPLSRFSADCPYHSEATDGGAFNFPPREMPTHSSRRAIISALQIIKNRNGNITNASQYDWVAIVTFDLTGNVVVAHSLDDNYDGAMQDCTTLQACSDSAACTSTETGLMTAINHLNAQGRNGVNKVVVLLTDGKPNLYSSSAGTISGYENTHPNDNFYGSQSYYPQDAAMMQASIMQRKDWSLFPVQLGLQGDQDFMNRLYSVGQGEAAETKASPYNAVGDPSFYETELKQIFDFIISNPKLRLVQ